MFYPTTIRRHHLKLLLRYPLFLGGGGVGGVSFSLDWGLFIGLSIYLFFSVCPEGSLYLSSLWSFVIMKTISIVSVLNWILIYNSMRTNKQFIIRFVHWFDSQKVVSLSFILVSAYHNSANGLVFLFGQVSFEHFFLNVNNYQN